MKEKINRLAMGIVDTEMPRLEIQSSPLVCELYAGAQLEGEIQLREAGGATQLKGLIYSNHERVTVSRHIFAGARSKIRFMADARGLEAGEQLRGVFLLISNAGELELPFHFTVQAYPSGTLLRELKNPGSLGALFHKDEERALRLFDDPAFVDTALCEKAQVRAVYEGLRPGADRMLALRSFLAFLHQLPAPGTPSETGEKPELPPLHAEQLEDAELLGEVCSLCIQAEEKSAWVFPLYRRAVELGQKVLRLYEYYLRALPSAEEQTPFPREIYLYFLYEKHLEPESRLKLYANICRCFGPDDEIFQRYAREMQDFMLEQLFDAQINEELAALYATLLYEHMIDRRMAEVLPSLLRSRRLHCEDSGMTQLILRDEALAVERIYPIKDGFTYFPLYYDHPVYLFADAYGRRYCGLKYTVEAMFDRPEMEKRCYRLYPEHPELRRREAMKLFERGLHSAQELKLALALAPELSEVYGRKLRSMVLSYLHSLGSAVLKHADGEVLLYLRLLEPLKLELSERIMLWQLFVWLEDWGAAYQLLDCLPTERLDRLQLERLLSACLNQKPAEDEWNEDLLRCLLWHCFARGSKQKSLLQALIRDAQAPSALLYQLFKRAQSEELETDTLVENILAQQLFAQQESQLDLVFSAYMQLQKRDERLVAAYLTQRSADYFLKESQPLPYFFEQLEAWLRRQRHMDAVPTIYLLAISHYFAEQKKLQSAQRSLLALVMEPLLRENLIFAYTRQLAAYVPLPERIVNREYIEYRGRRDEQPELWVRVQPEEERFHAEDIPRVYQHIYVRAFLLFEGERLEYRLFDSGGSMAQPSAEGGLLPRAQEGAGGQFAMINQMSALLAAGNKEALLPLMESYVVRQRLVSELEQMSETLPDMGELPEAAQRASERAAVPGRSRKPERAAMSGGARETDGLGESER